MYRQQAEQAEDPSIKNELHIEDHQTAKHCQSGSLMDRPQKITFAEMRLAGGFVGNGKFA